MDSPEITLDAIMQGEAVPEPRTFYDMSTRCWNCKVSETCHIPKGEAFADYVRRTRCPNCGVTRKSKDEETT